MFYFGSMLDKNKVSSEFSIDHLTNLLISTKKIVGIKKTPKLTPLNTKPL
jgi:hypothetical protein